ncbi:MAG: RbsD/FucU domain-containing protein [Erythrobacter sp.]|uniref:RbsD/FucU family protein n=1 Tax=Erythrobacter sp. TaxID=1042 RepID=UPI00263715CD|nr:RbsD/FucU domain-containing protein [Erythrobacter sp.]MDJ0978132.1 RbsD/FucU domain-containing protein [Erythrobacter sp.]
MLKGIDPVLGPDLLHALRSMGHGDEIVIADANFPVASHAQRLVRADGIGAERIVRAVAAIMPLDDFVPAAAFSMQVVDAPEKVPPIVERYGCLLSAERYRGEIVALERSNFYKRARAAFAIVATGETALYANLILKKGIVRPQS